MKRKDKKGIINLEDVLEEIKATRILAVNDAVINEYSSDYSDDEYFKRWGEQHFRITREIIQKNAERKKSRKDYLLSLKANFDDLTDHQLVTNILEFVGIALSVIMVLIGLNVDKPIWQTMYYLSVVVLLISICFAFVYIETKYAYKSRFYRHVIDSLVDAPDLQQTEDKEYHDATPEY